MLGRLVFTPRNESLAAPVDPAPGQLATSVRYRTPRRFSEPLWCFGFSREAFVRAGAAANDGGWSQAEALSASRALCDGYARPLHAAREAYWLHRDPDFLEQGQAWLDGEIKSGDWHSILETALKARCREMYECRTYIMFKSKRFEIRDPT